MNPTLMSKIHPTAQIHPKAEIHPTAEIGAYCVVGEHVVIGPGTQLIAHVVVDGWTQIGANNRVFPYVVIGGEPQDRKFRGAPTQVIIGNNNQIREFVTINRATHEGESTLIGDDNMLLAYVHVAHNCVIGNRVTISNSVQLAGHVTVESQAVIGGLLGIHQFVHIGRLAMLGAMSRVERDVPPFTMIEGNPARIRGLNLVGLQRSGISADQDGETFALLRKAFRTLYRSDYTLDQGLALIAQLPANPAVDHLTRFLQESLTTPRRGPVPGMRRSHADGE